MKKGETENGRYPVCQDVYDLASPEQRQYLTVDTRQDVRGGNQLSGNSGVLKTRTGNNETEADFASWFEDVLRVHGYKFAHFRPARVMRNGKETYETPVSGNAKGLPDYYVWHPERRPHLGFRESAFWVELKSEKGKLSEAQIECIKSLRASGAQVFIWRPDDRADIETLLA